MAQYGAMIDVNGNPFITPNSTPFIFYGKASAQSSKDAQGYLKAVVNMNIPDNYPAMAFCRTDGYPAAMSIGRTPGRIGASGIIQIGNQSASYTLHMYVFARFPQPIPKWGMAIWDEGGTCILTNESKVLTDLITVGQVGVNGGINLNQTVEGRLAVSPRVMGASLNMVQIPGQQPVIVMVEADTSATFDGARTKIMATPTQNPGGQPQGYMNTGCNITAIRTDLFD